MYPSAHIGTYMHKFLPSKNKFQEVTEKVILANFKNLSKMLMN